MSEQTCWDKNIGEQFTCGQLRVEIDRLKAELKEAQGTKMAQKYNVAKQAIASQKRRIQELKDDMELLERRLAEANHTVERYVSEMANTSELLKELAEARAEAAEFKATIQPGCCGIATCPGVAEARQEAARTFLDLAEEYEGGKCELYDLVAKRFGLEG